MTGDAQSNLITIHVTPEEAALFLAFRKYQTVFENMIEAKVFDIKNGSATIDFSPQGELMDIRFNVIAFRRKSNTHLQS